MLKIYKPIVLLSSVLIATSSWSSDRDIEDCGVALSKARTEAFLAVKASASSYGVPGMTCGYVAEKTLQEQFREKSHVLSNPKFLTPEDEWWNDYIQSKTEITRYVASLALYKPKAAAWFLLTGGKNGFAQRQASAEEARNLISAIDIVATEYTTAGIKNCLETKQIALKDAGEDDCSSSDDKKTVIDLDSAFNLLKWIGLQEHQCHSTDSIRMQLAIHRKIKEIGQQTKLFFANQLSVYPLRRNYNEQLLDITEQAKHLVSRQVYATPDISQEEQSCIYHLEMITQIKDLKKNVLRELNKKICTVEHFVAPIDFSLIKKKAYTDILFELLIHEHRKKALRQIHKQKQRGRKVSPVSSIDSKAPLSSSEETTLSEQSSEDSQDAQSAS